MASKLGFSAEVILARFKALKGVAAGSSLPKTVFLSFVGAPAGLAIGGEQLSKAGLVTISDDKVTLTEAGLASLKAA